MGGFIDGFTAVVTWATMVEAQQRASAAIPAGSMQFFRNDRPAIDD
jgi:hypothetical protein